MRNVNYPSNSGKYTRNYKNLPPDDLRDDFLDDSFESSNDLQEIDAVGSHKDAQAIIQQLGAIGISESEKGIHLERNQKNELISKAFNVRGRAITSEGAYFGILIQFITGEGTYQNVVLPFEDVRDLKKLAQLLQVHGVDVSLENYALKAISKYIYTKSKFQNIVVLENEGAGWIATGDTKYPVAIIGNQIIAPSKVNAVAVLKHKSIYASKGVLTKWRESAKEIMPNNFILIAVICAALSAPLKQLFNLPLLSLLLAGFSGSGKTTIARFINSLFGKAHDPFGWSGTVNGLEALAIRHCDAPLALDEMAEGRASDVLDATYRLNNGVQKTRAKSDGGLQESAEIRALIIATSEVTLSEHSRSSGRAMRQGHEARMPTLVLNEEYGAFNSLNDYQNAEELPAALDKLGRECYGVVWPAYLGGLIKKHDKCAKFIVSHRDEFAKMIATDEYHDTLNALERRVLSGFTSWALAGEMAIRLEVLPLKKNDAVNAVMYAYSNWLTRWRSSEGTPHDAIISHVRDFLQRKSQGRLVSICDWDSHGRSDLVGFENYTKKHGGMYLMMRGFFEKELCKEYGLDNVLTALDKAGFLLAHKGGRTWLQRMPNENGKDKDGQRMRFYAIKYSIIFDK
jgi:uncharacterized protein (DUF927 family)